MVEDSIQCYDIDPYVAISQYWCVSYQPNDPICSAYTQQSSCSDTVEQRSVACTEPNTVGFVNESRTYTCASDSWSDWTVSSNNCTPAPPTCFESQEERAVACQDGYTGSITEYRELICSTPYSMPTPGPWITSSDSCTLKATDPTSIESPLNPASPLSLDQQDPVGITSGIVDMTPTPMDNPVEQEMAIPQEKTEEQEQKSTTQPSTSNSTETKEEKKTEAKQEQKIKLKENEDVIPGFGIAISFALIEQPVMYQQQDLTNILNLEQEQNYAREQDFLLNLIQSDDYSSDFDSLANYRWRSLLHDNPLQSDAFSN